jgi:hypothetical protein
MVHRALMICLLLAVGACTSGPAEFATEPIPPGWSQLVVSRESRLTFVGVKALVDVNGDRIAELSARDDDLLVPIRSGPTTVSVAGSSEPGRYSIRFNAEGGKTYRLEISPRQEGYLPPAETAVATTENAGAFKIMPEKDSSLMQDLRRGFRSLISN